MRKSIVHVVLPVRHARVANGEEAYSRWLTSTHQTHQPIANDNEWAVPEIITQPGLSAMAGFRGPRMNEVLCCCAISLPILFLGVL